MKEAGAMILGRIELDPRVCNGKPVIRGTRIPVTVIIDYIATGESWETVLKEFPVLTRDDIAAALAYARASIEHTEIIEQAR